MLEFLICSMVTILPDYLIRRYLQGKRIGKEITLYSVWYVLRWGITACVMLTVTLITVIFYYHPSTTHVTSFFRTVTILPEQGGRVAEVLVENNEQVAAGQVLFRLDDSSQQAAVASAKTRIAEIEASILVARSDLASAEGSVQQAEGRFDQAQQELDRNLELRERNADVVSQRQIDLLQSTVISRAGALASATAKRDMVEVQIGSLLPAQRQSAEAALRQAEVELEKTVVYSGIDGYLQQFALKPGDYVSPVLRPAGIVVPLRSERVRIQAGFNQIAAQVIKPGMIGEITCISKPFTIIPMVVADVQEVISSGQLRPSDQLVDIQDRARPGTLGVFLEPLYEGQIDSIPPGSKCIANVYTSNHDRLDSEDLGTGEWLFLHVVDTVGIVHAIILRIQALLLPVQTLVLSGH